jgi:hypothetical protein
LTMQIAAVPIRPIHHRSYRKTGRVSYGIHFTIQK